VIELRGVTVERGGRPALTVDALAIGAGVTALVGPNGSGKSTLLHLVAGLLEPARGEVRVFGVRPAEARRRMAYVLQAQHAGRHLPVTAREVVALGRASSTGAFRRLTRSDRAAVAAAMERVEIADLANSHLSEMSGGERQRVLIAQGLAQGADVLLLDEPVAGLDIASIATIRRIVDDERAAGRTIVVATHDLAEAAVADAAVLLNGRVVAAGSPADVLAPARLREAYAGRLVDVGHAMLIDDGAHHHVSEPDPHGHAPHDAH
jgi:ABC-type Mn2+/Zn2+ transport system ATPase subunit